MGEDKRKKLKNVVLKGISETLGTPIANWEDTQSDSDYNAYLFTYPTQIVEIENYIGIYLESKGHPELAQQYHLDKFPMNLQSLERTYIDKVFALCDYYLQGKTKRYSRHLYDIYKLTSQMQFDDAFIRLVREVREHRAGMEICPSAQENVDVPVVILEFCDNAFYKEDYETITSYFAGDQMSYVEVIEQMRKIAQSPLFLS